MAENEFTIPTTVRKALMDEGYPVDTAMQAHVTRWWNWYTAQSEWYDRTEQVADRTFKVRRMTLHPARRVCREWTSVILDDSTSFTVEGTDVPLEACQDWLDGWIRQSNFTYTAQSCLERAFALGTGAMALWFDVEDDTVSRIMPRRYDARMVVPLSWDDDGITECAFCTTVVHGGKRLDQLQMHVIRDGTYHIVTRCFDKDGEVSPDGYIADFDTRTDHPTFCIVKPAIDNVYVDMSPFGQSVFADAIDAIKSVDNAFDSFNREIDATKVKVFMTDDLLDVVDSNGRKAPIPLSPDNMVIRKMSGSGTQQMLEVFAPDIRIDPLRTALDMSLAQLGDLTGFGAQYFRLDVSGGLKTATEVNADNSAFFRNIAKHEHQIGPQVESLLGAVLACAGAFGLAEVPQGVSVRVDFDDSIIADTMATKQMELTEISSLGVPALKSRYLERHCGYTADEAEALVAAGPAEDEDTGF